MDTTPDVSTPQPNLSSLPAEILLLIDTSHSSTTITPLLRGQPIHSSVRRLPLGGKHLSAYLAELISLRHISLIDEPHLVSQIKHDVSFVSGSAAAFAANLDASWHFSRKTGKGKGEGIVVDYVLPDYERLHRGFTRPHDGSHAARMAKLGLGSGTQTTDPSATGAATVEKENAAEDVITLTNERFSPAELLFNPPDIGLQALGIPALVFAVLDTLPRSLWPGLLANIVVVGGNSLIPGLVERVESEVRMLAPAEMAVRVARPLRPDIAVWEGGARFAQAQVKGKVGVSREEYLEHGALWTARRMRELGREMGGKGAGAE